MKQIVAALSLMVFVTLPFKASAQYNAEQWFVHGSALTSYYQYEEDDARKVLPDSVTQLLDIEDFVGDDSDYLNISLGFGYYLRENLALSLTYTSDIELNFFDDLLTNIFVPGEIDPFTTAANIQLFELDATYIVFDFSPSAGLFVKGGAVINRLSVKVNERQGDTRERVASTSETEVGAKFGVGLQWDFSDNWGLKLGYSHLTFMSIDKTYLMLEYRF